jgi:hypothetical protein
MSIFSEPYLLDVSLSLQMGTTVSSPEGGADPFEDDEHTDGDNDSQGTLARPPHLILEEIVPADTFISSSHCFGLVASRFSGFYS